MSDLRLKLVLEAIDKMTSPMRKMSEGFNASIKKMQDATKKLSDQMNKVGKSMRDIGGKMSLYVSTPIMGLGVLSLKSAANVETLTLSLSGLAGGLGNAKVLMRELMVLADRSGKSLESVTTAASILMAAGYKGNNLTEQMRRITEISTGSKIELEQLAEAIAKIRSEGKLEKGEIELLQKSSIPIIETLAEVLGKPRSAIVKMAEEGKIAAKDVERALGRMTTAGGIYYNKMAERGSSINGLLEGFRFNMFRIMSDLGFEIAAEFDIAGKLKFLTDATRGLADGFMGLPKPVKQLIVYGGLLLAIAGPLIMIIGQMTIGIAGMIWAFGVLSPAIIPVLGLLKMLTIGLLTTPFGWFILGATALATVVFLIIKNWGKIKAFFADIWGGIKQSFANGVAAVMDMLQPLLNVIATIKGGLGKIGTAMTDNPVTRFVRETAGPAGSASTAQGSGYVVPVAPGAGAAQRVDAGGTLRIKIDSEGRARVVESRPNDRRMDYTADTGLLMGTP